jgi:hypothetical protein
MRSLCTFAAIASFGRISSDLAGMREFHTIVRHDFSFFQALTGLD